MTSRVLAAMAGLLLMASTAWLASSARAQIFVDAEAQLRVQWLQMKREMPRHPNPAVQRFVECITWSIIDVIPEDQQNLDWEVIVFDNGATNASVTPEGKIAVFTGILQVANTPDELAAVIGHEMAHLTEGHVSERVNRMRAVGVAGILGSAVAGLGSESQAAAEVGMLLPFQRGQESEADIVGMQYMAEAGYNPSAVLELWREMGGNQRRSDWLSTHPEPSLRMQDMARNLAPALKTYNDALDAGVRPRCRL